MPRVSSRTAAHLCSIAARFLLPMPRVAGNAAVFKGRGAGNGLPDLGCAGVRKATGDRSGQQASRKREHSKSSHPLRRLILRRKPNRCRGDRRLPPEFVPQLVQWSNDRTDRPATPDVLRTEDSVDFPGHRSHCGTGGHGRRQGGGRGEISARHRALSQRGSDSCGTPAGSQGKTGSQHSRSRGETWVFDSDPIVRGGFRSVQGHRAEL
jgi:hypothetical protein